ncbi:MAG: hypothetical protein C3F13_14215 [Anaerolineales bacterium]|nr:MAG: hypothetical protein C3F13_14215 [Anaerolineales bacterium]
MKIKHFILFFAILALSACTQAASSEQPTITSAPTNTSVPTDAPAPASPMATAVVTQAEVIDKIEAICFRNSDETRLLINDIQGYCLQYPVGYDIVFSSDMDIMLMKRSVLNSLDPSLFIHVEPSNGRTVEQAADQLIADYSVPSLEVKRASLEIDQEQAIMLDGLTGQDINRQVVVLHNDRLYHLTIMPMEGSPDVHTQAEALYNTLIQSFNFRPETNLCPDCPPPTERP